MEGAKGARGAWTLDYIMKTDMLLTNNYAYLKSVFRTRISRLAWCPCDLMMSFDRVYPKFWTQRTRQGCELEGQLKNALQRSETKTN